MKKILVLGAGGPVGRWICRCLAQRDDLELYGRDDSEWNRHMMEVPEGGPMKGAAEALMQMKLAGHEVIIWTARPDYTTFEIGRLLDGASIPYDFILGGKLYFDVFIDDHAKEFKGWGEDYGLSHGRNPIA